MLCSFFQLAGYIALETDRHFYETFTFVGAKSLSNVAAISWRSNPLCSTMLPHEEKAVGRPGKGAIRESLQQKERTEMIFESEWFPGELLPIVCTVLIGATSMSREGTRRKSLLLQK